MQEVPITLKSVPRSTAVPAARERLARGLVSFIVAIILIGFAKNFYLRAWLGTRHLTALAYAHGFVMTAWVGLFILQLWLIASGRAQFHRRVGQWGAAIAAVLVGLGVVTIAFAAHRLHPQADLKMLAAVFVAFDGLSLLLFGALVWLGISRRAEPAVHRRLMLMAMIALLPPAFGRLVAYVLHTHVELIVLSAMISMILLSGIIDVRKTGRLHRAVAVPGIAIIAANIATYVAQIYI